MLHIGGVTLRLTLVSLLLEAKDAVPEPQYLNEPIGKASHSSHQWVATACTTRSQLVSRHISWLETRSNFLFWTRAAEMST